MNLRLVKRRELHGRYFALWKELTGWRLFLFYAAHYTVLFMVLGYFVFLPFYEEGKGFVW